MSSKSNRNSWVELLVSYFANIIYSEEKIELKRLKLYSQNDFNPEYLFSFIDLNNKNNINLNDFRHYLNNNNISFNEDVVRKLIRNFDKDNDFCLDFNEFLNMITPKKNKNYQKKNINFGKLRPNINRYSDCNNFNINDKVNKCFASIVIEEMDLIGRSNEIAESIIKSRDFTTYEAFVEIVGQEQYINEANLRQFLIKNNIMINKDDIHQLLFRLDNDNDGVISYHEFQKNFTLLKIDNFNFNNNQPQLEIKKIEENTNFVGNSYKNNDEKYNCKNKQKAEHQIDDDVIINKVHNIDLNKKENKSDIYLSSIESPNFKKLRKTININYTNYSEKIKPQKEKQNKKNIFFNTEKSTDKKIKHFHNSFKSYIHLSERNSNNKLQKIFQLPAENKIKNNFIYNTTNNTIRRNISNENNKFSLLNDIKLNYDYTSYCNNDDLSPKQLNNCQNEPFKDSPLTTNNNTSKTNYSSKNKTKIAKKKAKIPFSTRKKTEIKSKLKLFEKSTIKNKSNFRKSNKSKSRNETINNRKTSLSSDNNRCIKFNNSFPSKNDYHQTLRNYFKENNDNEKELYKLNNNDYHLQNLINSPSPCVKISNNNYVCSKNFGTKKEVENGKKQNIYNDSISQENDLIYPLKPKNNIKSNSFIISNNIHTSNPKKFTCSYLKNQDNNLDNKIFHIFDGIQKNNKPKKIFASNLNYIHLNKNQKVTNNDLSNNNDNDIKTKFFSSLNRIENNQYENVELFNIKPNIYSFEIHSNRSVNLFNLFKDILEKEIKLKNTKRILSNCNDLNINILFSIFDIKKRNLISYSDIYTVLNKLSANIDLNDIKYIFIRSNKNIKKKFDCQEFRQLFIDGDNQGNSFMYKNNIIRVDDLCIDSKQKINNLFNTVIECEKSNEYYRNILAMTPNSSGFDLFNLLKKKDNPGINKEDIANFVNSFDKKFNDDEINIIFNKLNKNNDDIIDYTQFVSEMTPKLIN